MKQKSEPLSIKEATERAYLWCARKEFCTAELKAKLISTNCTEEIAQKVIEKLQSEKFLDDARYAAAAVNDKFRFNKWGRIKIKYHLAAIGLDKEIIAQALENIDFDEYSALALDVISKKAKTIKVANKYELKSKLYRFAASRGFEANIITNAIEQIIKNLEE